MTSLVTLSNNTTGALSIKDPYVGSISIPLNGSVGVNYLTKSMILAQTAGKIIISSTLIDGDLTNSTIDDTTYGISAYDPVTNNQLVTVSTSPTGTQVNTNLAILTRKLVHLENLVKAHIAQATLLNPGIHGR
jgi:hypothetical protein